MSMCSSLTTKNMRPASKLTGSVRSSVWTYTVAPTRGLIDMTALKKMKSSAVLINVARGPVIVDEDLTQALEQGIIAGAGLDVLTKEPMTKDNPLHRIKDSRKLIITPHMAWASVEARQRCVDEIYLNIKAFLNGESRNRVD
ncbi:MAG: hypothetical protein IKT17_03610 [Lachnospiraceae bacterium]|nr:hypothetical protein [Lachnospiraceae bacterium]